MPYWCRNYSKRSLAVIFALIRSLAYYPQKILIPLLEELWIKAKAPFNLEDCVDKPEDASVENGACRMDELSYFPGLPKIRSRGIYVADKKFNDTICTKRSSWHPALLPGIFTLFCERGVYSGFGYHSTVIYHNVMYRCMLWIQNYDSDRITQYSLHCAIWAFQERFVKLFYKTVGNLWQKKSFTRNWEIYDQHLMYVYISRAKRRALRRTRTLLLTRANLTR